MSQAPIYLSEYQASDWAIPRTHMLWDVFDGHTDVTTTLELKNTNREGSVTADLVLNAVAMKQVGFEVKQDDGSWLAWQAIHENETYRLSGLPAACTLRISNQIVPETNTSLMGLYKSRELYCTQCEAEGFRQITPFLDRPDVLSVFSIEIRADRDYPVLLSNGNLIEAGTIDEQRHYAKWQDPHPKPCYLFAGVVGKLEKISDTFTTCSGKEVSLEIYAESQFHDRLAFAMDVLKQSMQWDEEYFGREYDLDRFMIVATEDFNFGAMENKGLNIFNVSALIAHPDTSTDAQYRRIRGIIAHEYFHNWSGNRVTLRDWFQLTLKEGFTVFRDALFSRSVGDELSSRIEEVEALRRYQFSEDKGRLSHPPRPDSYVAIDNFYTATVYEKGSEIIGMYRQLLGETNFRKASDHYFETFDGQAVRVEDFYASMQKFTDIDLGQFWLWYSQAGTPKVTVENSWDKDSSQYKLTFKQTLQSGAAKATESKPMMIPMKFSLLDKQSGQPVAVKVNKVTGSDGSSLKQAVQGDLLLLTQSEQSIEFSGIDRPVVPSLLREFSAPIEMDTDLTEAELGILARHDSDSFVRNDALRKLYLAEVTKGLAQPLTALSSTLIQAVEAILQDSQLSGLAKLLMLPCPKDLASSFNPMPILQVHSIRSTIHNLLARELKPHWLKLLEDAQSNLEKLAYNPFDKGSDYRALQSLAWGFLSRTDYPVDSLYQSYLAANNLTERFGVISSLQIASDCHQTESTKASQLLGQVSKDFAESFKHERQALDAWMSIQAMSDDSSTAQTVQSLTKHPHFTWKTPNRVRALIGGFASGSIQFHSEEGYRLVASAIATVDPINSSVAANLFGSFSLISSWPEELATLAKKVIAQELKTGNLSKQLGEQLERILA